MGTPLLDYRGNSDDVCSLTFWKKQCKSGKGETDENGLQVKVEDT
jgi:hypothetical protein